jgi:cytochrome P450
MGERQDSLAGDQASREAASQKTQADGAASKGDREKSFEAEAACVTETLAPRPAPIILIRTTPPEFSKEAAAAMAGSSILKCPYLTGRNRRQWMLEVDPKRWTRKRVG